MKRIWSKTESEFETELTEGENYLLGGGDPIILDVLQKEFGSIKSAYFLNGLSFSDYTNVRILVNGSTVCTIEISDGNIEVFEKNPVSLYKLGLKRREQIKLLVALDLAARN